MESISLGWRCEAAQLGVSLGLRKKKENGYRTCPFDLCVTNYIGLLKCIKDDFKYFCDPSYLAVLPAIKMKKILGDNQNDEEFFIVNTYYNFVFNHESPGHGNLYLEENWSGGINHYISNNFEKFIERYQDRINNFRNYLKSENKINFLIVRYNAIPNELEQILSQQYPYLDFTIYCWTTFSIDIVRATRKQSFEGARDFDIAYLEYMKIDRKENPEEYNRYYDNQPLNNTINRIILMRHDECSGII